MSLWRFNRLCDINVKLDTPPPTGQEDGDPDQDKYAGSI